MILVQEKMLAEQQRQENINSGKASLTGAVIAAHALAAIFAWTTHDLQVESCTKNTLSFLKTTDAFLCTSRLVVTEAAAEAACDVLKTSCCNSAKAIPSLIGAGMVWRAWTHVRTAHICPAHISELQQHAEHCTVVLI